MLNQVEAWLHSTPPWAPYAYAVLVPLFFGLAGGLTWSTARWVGRRWWIEVAFLAMYAALVLADADVLDRLIRERPPRVILTSVLQLAVFNGYLLTRIISMRIALEDFISEEALNVVGKVIATREEGGDGPER